MNVLPHAAIINNNTVAVHGGIPWTGVVTRVKDFYSRKTRKVFITESFEEFFTYDTMKKGIKVYNTILCAVWSDFEASVVSMRSNLSRGVPDSCEFGFNDLRSFFKNAADLSGAYGLKHLIRGHDHHKGKGFFQETKDDLSVTTLISSPILLAECRIEPVGYVAILEPDCAPKILFQVVL